MAVRKLTVSLPEELVRELTRRVPAQKRSRYVARAVERSLRDEDRELIMACKAANAEPDDAALRDDLDAMGDPVTETWEDAAAR